MKKLQLFLFLFLFALSTQAQTKIKAYLDTKQFYAPEVGHYLEVYIEFAGYTTQFVACEGGQKATVIVDLAVADTLGKVVFKDFYALARVAALVQAVIAQTGDFDPIDAGLLAHALGHGGD
jgi:hypothetical protein